jgi:predicted DCC family thiol-disulfide oxidoreductase YuxK
VFIYGMAALAKVQGPSWWNGMALWGTMTAGEFVTRDFTALAHWPLLVNLLTHSSLTMELLYPVLIWSRLIRPLMIMGMVALHLGIAIVAPGLTEFGLAMIAANLAFVPGGWLRSLATGREQPALQVIYDGACPRCRASMAMVTAADPDRVIEPIDLTAVDVATLHPGLTKKACMDSMHVILRYGRITAGFDGFRSVGAWLPILWAFTLFAWLPGVAWVGRRVYNYLASTRPRDIPCNDEVCGIHPPKKQPATEDLKRRSTRSTTPEEVGIEESGIP